MLLGKPTAIHKSILSFIALFILQFWYNGDEKGEIMKHLSLTITIVCLLLVSYTAVNGAEWVHYTTSKGLEDRYYYDKSSIYSDSEGAVRVWIKQDFSYKGKEHFIESMKKNGNYDIKKLNNVSHVLDYFAIKCSTREYKHINHYYVLDTDESVKDSGSLQPTWNSIPKKDPLELLHKAVCKGKL